VTFSGIPAGGDLAVVVSAGTTATSYLAVRLNGDTGSNYSFVQMYANGSSTYSTSPSSQTALFNNGLSTSAGGSLIKMDFLDASATDKHKSVIARHDWATGFLHAIAGRWASTAAITSIEISQTSSTWLAGSTFHLYQIVSE